jgi:hypothetical protein
MSDKTEWVTIKVPVSAYRQAVALRQLIARRGLDALPTDVQDTAEIAAGTGRAIGIGTIVAMGLLGLTHALGGAEKRARKPASRRRR